MPGYVLGVPGTNTIYNAFQATIHDEDKSVLWDMRYPTHLRGPKTRLGTWGINEGYWPSSGLMAFSSDPSARASLILNQDMGTNNYGDYEPWSVEHQGTASRKVIVGICYDSNSVIVSGATVQGFTTSDDQFVTETTADSNGRYEFGTPQVGRQHYLVAYRAGSPDIAGTTVNTLVPTNRDGT